MQTFVDEIFTAWKTKTVPSMAKFGAWKTACTLESALSTEQDPHSVLPVRRCGPAKEERHREEEAVGVHDELHLPRDGV